MGGGRRTRGNAQEEGGGPGFGRGKDLLILGLKEGKFRYVRMGGKKLGKFSGFKMLREKRTEQFSPGQDGKGGHANRFSGISGLVAREERREGSSPRYRGEKGGGETRKSTSHWEGRGGMGTEVIGEKKIEENLGVLF